MGIIMGSVYLLTVVIMYFNNRTAQVPNGNILLGVSLPHDKLTDPEVLEITERFRRMHTRVCLLAFLLVIAHIPLFNFVSLTLLFMTVWMTGFIWACQWVIARHFNELRALKNKHAWWTGERNVIRVDTEVSRFKDTFPISKKWYVFPIIFTLFGLFAGMPWQFPEGVGITFWIMQASAFLTLALFMGIHKAYENMRTQVYCENTEVNHALNRVSRREWTRCMVIVATINSAIMMFITLAILLGGNFAEMLVIIILLASAAVLLPFFIAFSNVRSVRNRLLRVEHEEIFTDEDDHWMWGAMFYNNPADTRLIVEKRVGFGMTTNMGGTFGKLMWIIIIGIVIFMLGMAVWMLPVDFGSVHTHISGGEVTINAPATRNFSFHVREMQSVELMDTLPPRHRVYGTGTARLNTGIFSVTGHGQSRLFVHLQAPPFIAIRLENEWIFVNAPAQTETLEIFNRLVELIE